MIVLCLGSVIALSAVALTFAGGEHFKDELDRGASFGFHSMCRAPSGGGV